MDCIDTQGYRSNVGIIITHEGLVLIGGRTDKTGGQFPQGGIQRGESAQEAMFRELKEEVGLKPRDVEMLGVTQNWLKYRLPKYLVRHQQKPVCIGQKQRWFLLRLTSNRERVRFDKTKNPEFDRARWVEYWHPVEEVIYFKRQVYIRALNELGPLAFPKKGMPPIPCWRPKQ